MAERTADIGGKERARVSVVIPTYNRAPILAAAIDSVLEQEPPPEEVIVVDDGSTDGTADLLAGYGDRIVALTRRNGGASAARNAGIARASGKWIAFLDSDDRWLPGRMACLHRDLAAMPAEIGLHVADLRYVGEGYDRRLFALRGCQVPSGSARFLREPLSFALGGVSCQSVAVRADWIETVGGFDETLHIYEDAAFFTRLALCGPWAVAGDVVAEVRRLPEDAAVPLSTLERSRRLEITAARSADLETLAGRADLTPRQRRALARYASGMLLKLAAVEAEAGQGGWRKTLRRAATLHPEPLRGWVKSAVPAALGRFGFTLLLPDRRRIRRS